MRYKNWLIPALILFSMCMAGCCTCRQGFVIITIPSEHSFEIIEEKHAMVPQGLPMNRIDSLFIKVQNTGRKVRIEAHEATKHLIP